MDGPKVTKRTRLSDIAQLAGVSQATVSLVLNSMSGARIAPATRQKVQAIAAELGYTRKSAVQRGGAPVILLLIDEVITTPFAAPFIEGARLQASARGALLVTCCTGGDPAVEAAAIQSFRAAPLAGVLYATLVTRMVRVPPLLDGVPTVLLNCHAVRETVPSVVPGDVLAGFAATTALIKAGHRRIAHIGGEDWGEAARDRALGYRRALASADIAFSNDLLAGPAWTAVSGREAMLRLLDLPKPPTAVFCFNDRVALGAYEAAAERGLRLPDDLSVVGFDNDDIAATLRPPLTTMVLPHEDMARWAVDRLSDSPGASVSRVKFDCELIERGSVKPPAI
jgi:LacI family transcriptional regulator